MSRKRKQKRQQVTVAEATADDLQVIVAMAESAHETGVQAALGDFDPDAIQRFASSVIASPDDGIFLLAKIDGAVVGMIGLFLIRAFIVAGELTAQEFTLWVEPEHRQHGVGSALLDAAAEWSVGRGAKILNVTAMKDQSDLARRFLAKGFRLLQSTYSRSL